MNRTHIHSASHAFTLLAVRVQTPGLRGLLLGAGREVETTILDVDGHYLVRQKETMEDQAPSTANHASVLAGPFSAPSYGPRSTTLAGV